MTSWIHTKWDDIHVYPYEVAVFHSAAKILSIPDGCWKLKS